MARKTLYSRQRHETLVSMNTNHTHRHPTRTERRMYEALVGSVAIASLKRRGTPVSASSLAASATSAVREAVKDGKLPETVMTMSKGYVDPEYMVPTSLVNKLLAAAPEAHDLGVGMDSGYNARRSRHWVISEYFEAQKLAEIERETTWAQAHEHVRLREVWDGFQVIKLNREIAKFVYRINTGWQGVEALEEIIMPKAEVEKAATRYAAEVRRLYVAEMMAA